MKMASQELYRELETRNAGKTVRAFPLKPSDIIFVPEKFAWF